MDTANIKRRQYWKKYHAKNKDKINARRRELYKEKPEFYLNFTRQWHEKNPTYVRDFYREYNKTGLHPNGNKTRNRKMWTAQNTAIKEATLAKFCELCPEDDKREAINRHHMDYDFPLIFVSLCQSCHTYVHAQLRRKKSAICHAHETKGGSSK